MILGTELVSGLASAVVFFGGFIAGRRKMDKQPRCSAYLTEQFRDFPQLHPQTKIRCRERADPRCQAGYCRIHCSQDFRCNNICIKDWL